MTRVSCCAAQTQTHELKTGIDGGVRLPAVMPVAGRANATNASTGQAPVSLHTGAVGWSLYCSLALADILQGKHAADSMGVTCVVCQARIG